MEKSKEVKNPKDVKDVKEVKTDSLVHGAPIPDDDGGKHVNQTVK